MDPGPGIRYQVTGSQIILDDRSTKPVIGWSLNANNGVGGGVGETKVFPDYLGNPGASPLSLQPISEGCSERSEAAFEDSRQEAPNPYLTFSDQGDVSGQRQVKKKITLYALGSVRRATRSSNSP